MELSDNPEKTDFKLVSTTKSGVFKISLIREFCFVSVFVGTLAESSLLQSVSSILAS
jgi:hypothetical protein